jgi:hypothetical protein
MNLKTSLILTLIGLLVLNTLARSINRSNNDDDDDDDGFDDDDFNEKKERKNSTEQKNNNNSESSDRKKSKTNKALLNWEKTQKKIQKQDKKRTTTKKTTTTTTHEYELDENEIDYDATTINSTTTTLTPSTVSKLLPLMRNDKNFISENNFDSSTQPILNETSNFSSATPTTDIQSTESNIFISPRKEFSISTKPKTITEELHLNETGHTIVDLTMKTSSNSEFKSLTFQENKQNNLNFSDSHLVTVNTNVTKAESKPEFDESTFKLTEEILQTLKKGININNINGSTNIIIAIGGHINIDRNSPTDESSKNNFKVSFLKNDHN